MLSDVFNAAVEVVAAPIDFSRLGRRLSSMTLNRSRTTSVSTENSATIVAGVASTGDPAGMEHHGAECAQL
jgi:hypothetical protein